jgi:3-phenylpropionate/cinnamic acid dioxygenase small subunit
MTGIARPAGGAEVGAIDLQEAAAFIWLEADLLDTQDYTAWLGLWTTSGRYIIPVDREGEEYASRLNIAYDDAAMREARVKRLCSGLSMSSAPAARTVRTVSRLRLLASSGAGLTLRAAQLLVEYKYDRTRVLAADVAYRLIRTADGLKLDEKVVRLINSDDALHGVGYLL